jgi:hypothetical protein
MRGSKAGPFWCRCHYISIYLWRSWDPWGQVPQVLEQMHDFNLGRNFYWNIQKNVFISRDENNQNGQNFIIDYTFYNSNLFKNDSIFSMKFSRRPKSLYSDDQLVNDMLGSGFDYSILPACGTLGWDHGLTRQQPRPPAPHINHLPRSARPCLSRPPLLLPAPLVEPWSSCLRPFPARHLFPAAARPGTPFSSSFPNQGELGFFHHSHCWWPNMASLEKLDYPVCYFGPCGFSSFRAKPSWS